MPDQPNQHPKREQNAQKKETEETETELKIGVPQVETTHKTPPEQSTNHLLRNARRLNGNKKERRNKGTRENGKKDLRPGPPKPGVFNLQGYPLIHQRTKNPIILHLLPHLINVILAHIQGMAFSLESVTQVMVPIPARALLQGH